MVVVCGWLVCGQTSVTVVQLLRALPAVLEDADLDMSVSWPAESLPRFHVWVYSWAQQVHVMPEHLASGLKDDDHPSVWWPRAAFLFEQPSKSFSSFTPAALL